jgi:Domain of unknown function (DUF1929)
LLSSAASTPANVFNVDYSHVFQFPFALAGGRDVLMLGMAGEPIFMAPTTTPQWLPTGQIRPGVADAFPPMHGSSTVILPLRLNPSAWGYNLGAVMTVGGGGMARQARADVYDAVGGGWQANGTALGVGRHHPSAVLLPDGRIFVIGGHSMADPQPYAHGVMLTPSASGYTAANTAAMAGPRGYHAAAVLLPDGRVLVAGGRTGGADSPGNEQPSVEYYLPDYMAGPRPSITSAPTEIRYETPFAVGFSGTTAPSELVLMALGSMTHSFDANQRAIQLVHVQTAPGMSVGYLAGGERFAPPGYYMLFLLDAQRRPSIARMVRVTR